MKSILKAFPPPASEEQATVCERNAVFISSAPLENLFKELAQTAAFPEIDVTSDLHRLSLGKETARSAFLDYEESGITKFKRIWYEGGVAGILAEIAAMRSEQASWMSYLASQALRVSQWISNAHEILTPSSKRSPFKVIADYSPNSSWDDSYVHAAAWHPTTTKLALALRDDSVKVYQQSRPDFVPVLKHKQQKGVSSLAWRPNNTSMLAVGCQAGVVVWSLEPSSIATRPSSGAATVWTYPGHSPVTSVAWQPQGRLLFSVSPTSCSILVWCVDNGEHVALHRWSGGGFVRLYWSPDCTKLLATCPSAEFRVFESRTWNSERWTKLTSRIQCACWNPASDIIFFVPCSESIIYAIILPSDTDQERPSCTQAAAVADVSKVDMEVDGNRVMVGGLVKEMIWDKTGERLALLFTGPGSDYVAVFQTRIYPSIRLIPLGLVKGYMGESPDLISFCPAFDEGALLTVAWNSGRVSHIPLYFLSHNALMQGKTVQTGQHHVPLQNLYSLDL